MSHSVPTADSAPSPRLPGLSYALTADGLELPVIDIARPAFSLEPSEAEIAAAIEGALRDLDARAAAPAASRESFLAALQRESRLAREIGCARDGIVGGLGTYMLKLGPSNLGPWAGDLDRAIASSLPCLSARLRLRDCARLLASSLRSPLSARPGADLVLVDIAGGPVSSTLNAILELRRGAGELLANRRVRILVLDRDSEGPAFGARCLEALRSSGGALEGLDIALDYLAFDWRDPAALGRILREAAGPRSAAKPASTSALAPKGRNAPGSATACGGATGPAALTAPAAPAASVLALVSEGGLVDYGADAEVVAVLSEAAAIVPGDAVFVGTASRPDGGAGRMNGEGGIGIVLRGLEDVSRIAQDSGWLLGASLEEPLARSFVLEPRRQDAC